MMQPETPQAQATGPVVLVVDDDPSVRRSLRRLFASAGRRCETFGSIGELLRAVPCDVAGCLVLDVRLPGMGGLELQQFLREAGFSLPAIFITGYVDVPITVRAMKSGAVDFLSKPFDDSELLSAVERAIAIDAEARRERVERSALECRGETLTHRERQVFGLVAAGLLNKQVAGQLGMSEKTVKVHRARVMQKMQAGSLAELVRMAERLEQSTPLEFAAARWGAQRERSAAVPGAGHQSDGPARIPAGESGYEGPISLRAPRP